MNYKCSHPGRLIGRLMTVLAFCTLITSPLLAQDDVDFSEMSLEDLLNVEVVTASKQAESSWDAPAVITTITSTEIEKFGAIQLREVLERVLGFTPDNTGNFHSDTMRAGDPLSANYHVLLLIDGRPIRESYLGGQNFATFALFPLIAIERIEIIRGPGSALYGTNAFEGVVNIITKKAESQTVEARLRAGSKGGENVDLYWGTKKGDFSFNIAASYFKEDGSTYQNLGFFGNEEDPQDDFQDNMALNATMKYKGFSLSLFNGEADWNNLYFGSAIPFVDNNKVTAIDLGYEHSFNDNWSMKFDVSRVQNDFSFVGVDIFDGFVNERNAEDTLLELTMFGQIGERVNLLFGGTHENITGDGFEIEDYDKNRWSIYGQANIKVHEKANLILGGQFNTTEESEDFVPRFGVIANFNERWGMKLLNGTAFRSPSVFQTNVDQAGTSGGAIYGPNNSLGPETVTTLDLQIFHNADKYQVAFTAFQSKQEDLILGVTNPDPNYLLQFQNVGTLDVEGIEIESKFVPNEHWYILASYAAYDTENQDGLTTATLSPDYQLKIGASYSTEKLNISVFDAFWDAYKDNVFQFPNRPLNQPEPNSFHWVTANFSYRFTVGKTRMSLEAYGTNLLDENVYTPSLETGAFNTVPFEQGRNFYGSLKFMF